MKPSRDISIHVAIWSPGEGLCQGRFGGEGPPYVDLRHYVGLSNPNTFVPIWLEEFMADGVTRRHGKRVEPADIEILRHWLPSLRMDGPCVSISDEDLVLITLALD